MSDQKQAKISSAFLGIILMLTSTLLFSLMNSIIRWLSVEQQMHAFEIAFFRNVFGLVFMLPWLVIHGVSGLKTERIGLFWIRALLGLVSMLGFFWAMTKMPLSQAVALSFTVPIFVTIGAVVFLGEQVQWRRWAAIIVGFIGTLIILRPSAETHWIPSLAVLGASVTMAASVLIIKELSSTESSNSIVTYMVLMLVPISFPTAYAVWQWPAAEAWVLLVAMGGLGTAAHLLFTNSLKIADVSLVMPFDFGRLIFIVLLAWLFFEESVDRWTLVGAVVVFSSGVYIATRESKMHNKKVITNKRIAGPS